MLIAIDIGNTNIVIGGIQDDRIAFEARIATDHIKTSDQYGVEIKNILALFGVKPCDVDDCIISSVVPPVFNSVYTGLVKMTGKHPLVVGPGIKTGLNIQMDVPSQVGSDRIVIAVAALAEYEPPLTLLDLGTACGFDRDLWQCYLTWLLMTNENSFTRTCEREGVREGSVNRFARDDLAVFRRLFAYDFGPLEQDLGLDCFSVLRDYRAIPKRTRMYSRDVSRQVLALREQLAAAEDDEAFFRLVTDYYRRYGYGVFAMNRAFRISRRDGGPVEFLPISNVDDVRLSDLLGYEDQKRELRRNTEAFLEGRAANNVLLYGDAGTGKSTSVKALINEYYDRGLRMIEIYKHQFGDLSAILAQVKERNYRFIIFIDDLSFADDDDNFAALKAVLEGGLASRPDNVLIYATSNRRHLLRETFSDRAGDEVHHADTVQEAVSLSDRFGISLTFLMPDKQRFLDIVEQIAEDRGLRVERQALLDAAERWALERGARSPRYARQFIADAQARLARGESL